MDRDLGEYVPFSKDILGDQLKDGVLSVNSQESVNLVLEKSNPLQIVFTILKWVLILAISVGAVIGGYFGFKKYQEQQANKESEARVNDDSINTTISEEGEVTSDTLSNEETIESSVKYVGINLELFKDKNLKNRNC